jgi:hypothetical protein
LNPETGKFRWVHGSLEMLPDGVDPGQSIWVSVGATDARAYIYGDFSDSDFASYMRLPTV